MCVNLEIFLQTIVNGLFPGSIYALVAIIQWGLVQRVLDAHPLNQNILLLDVSTLMIGLVQFSWTAQPQSIHVPYETEVLVFQG